MGGKGSSGTVGNRGGKGGNKRQPRNYSEKLKKQLWDALDDAAKKHGTTIPGILVSMAYSNNPRSSTAKQFAVNKILDVFVTKETKSTVEKIETKSPVFFPPIKERDEPVVATSNKDFIN